jgi:hypothetical protein
MQHPPQIATPATLPPGPADHVPLRHVPLRRSGDGGRITNTEARALVATLRGWAGQFNHEEAQHLQAALEDVDRCFVRVWTEIDEALTRLSLMQQDPGEAAAHLSVAQEYLHRWQDRGGRIGNGERPHALRRRA